MYGWRARIGHICPSTPLNIQYLRPEDFDRATAMLEDAARFMAEGEVDCIVAGGDPVITLKGSDREILDCIRKVTPVPAISSLGASICALEKLGLGRVVLASPY